MSSGDGVSSLRPLDIDVSFWGPGIAVVALSGDVDVYTAPRFRDTLVTLSGQGCHLLLIDLNQVDFIHTTGLGVLLGALKRAKSSGGSVELACSQESILRLLRSGGLIEQFRIYSSQAQARRYV